MGDFILNNMGKLLIALFGVMVLVVILAIREEIKWNDWAKIHCREIGEMSGDVFTTVGVSSNGSIVTGIGSTSSKTGYECDDGKQYWR